MSQKAVWIVSGTLGTAHTLFSVPPRFYSLRHTLNELAGTLSNPSAPTMSLQFISFNLSFNGSHLPINQYKPALCRRKLPLQRTEMHILFLPSTSRFRTCRLTSPEPPLFPGERRWVYQRGVVVSLNWIHIARIVAMILQDRKM